MQKFILINRKLLEEKQAAISVNQRACLFGDGIFETCRISNGKIYNFVEHKNRIKSGLSALKFSTDLSNLEPTLERDANLLIKKNQIKNGILRISISRGVGSLGYLPTNKSKPLIIIQTSGNRKVKSKRITLDIGATRKPSANSLPISCKTMQALPYTLNKIEAKEKGVFDCIMLSSEGFISETSSANIFWVKNGVIYTADENCDILLGTIRKKILENFEVKQVKVKIADLLQVDEIFLTNVSCLTLPVDELKIGKKSATFKKETSLEVLKWLKNDVKS